MRKLFIFAFFILLPQVCLGESSQWVDENGQEVPAEQVADWINNMVIDGAMDWAKKAEHVYESMKTCSPAESEAFQVYGVENELCHFNYGGYDCFVPLEVAREYADLALVSVRKFITGGGFSTENPETKTIEAILHNNDYCTYSASVELTMEDEDGNEITFERIVIE